jgi:CubicO group peptidase (beta-lactamase class C family)
MDMPRTNFRWIASPALLSALALSAALVTGCAEPPVQTGSNQVPEINVALAAAKDGKYDEMSWDLVDDEMDALVDGVTSPGCAVGVAIDEEIVYLKGYGRSRIGGAPEEWGVGTMGAVASVSKTFTALAAMRQVEENWVELDATADSELPLVGDLGDTTLRGLLSHTAGAGGGSQGAAFAPNWTAGTPMDLCQDADTPDAGDPLCTEVHRQAMDPVWLASSYATEESDNVFPLAGINLDADAAFEQSEAVYSNVGYTVAGGMVGAVAQNHGYDGYEHYVWDVVGQWGPSWLTPGQATSMALIHGNRATDIPHRAVGYYDANWGVGSRDWTQNDAWEGTTSRASWVGPSGGWALTIGDLTRLVVAYRRNQIVDAASRAEMETAFGRFDLGPDAASFPPYGLGVFVHDAEDTVWHGGDIGGKEQGTKRQSSNSAHWSWWMNKLAGGSGIGVTMMCNNGKGSGALYSTAKKIALALEDDPTSRPEVELGFATTPTTQGVNGRSYRLDASRAYVVAPAGFPILPSVADPLVAQANLSQGTVVLRKATSTTGGATVGQLGAAQLDGRGRLNAQGGSIQLTLQRLTLPVANAGLSFQVSNDGSLLFDGRMKASVDARNLVGLGAARDTQEVCTAVRAAKAACKPCLDGAKVCFDVALGGIQGKRIN